ncbi:ATP synthase F1 subcomplex delta subunit [Arenibacter nanhaiticus]|uniref:ATP synthase subunit delta n=1 Tax=Arenibacter nanhaiticus TaxID=558155 RepID=A0A1M6A652_9FLAO|nr:ATP synthase F1 subunit delta [Arenibacter nanhaiticus]SHI31889.1 ATP synthase F1 subcomplex delta subunit [Arenibacter nanhaiticus]
MNESRAAVRYAKAILDLAVDNKATDAVEKDMRSVVSTLTDSAELRELLANPVVKSHLKKVVLLDVFKGSNAITEGLINVLVENKRIGLLNMVAEKFILLNEARKGQGVAYVTTAVALTPALEKKIIKQVVEMTGNESTLENTIDESIIGGFILRVGDLQYDASIAHKLSSLKREFTNSL